MGSNTLCHPVERCPRVPTSGASCWRPNGSKLRVQSISPRPMYRQPHARSQIYIPHSSIHGCLSLLTVLVAFSIMNASALRRMMSSRTTCSMGRSSVVFPTITDPPSFPSTISPTRMNVYSNPEPCGCKARQGKHGYSPPPRVQKSTPGAVQA